MIALNKNKLYSYLYALLFSVIPFTEHIQAVPNIILAILIITFPFFVKSSDWKVLRSPVFFSLFILIIVVLTGIIINNRFEDFNFFTKILIIPFLLIVSIPIKNYRLPFYAFLMGSGSLLTMSLFNLTKHYLMYQGIKMDVGSEVNLLLMGERPYLGFIYLISFVCCVYLIKSEKNKLIKNILLFASIVFCLFILFIAARLSILSLMLILGSVIFFTQKKKRTFFISLGLISALGIFAFLNPNFINRFTAGFKQTEISIDKIISMEPRSHIWECSASIGNLNDVSFLGYGYRNTIDKLTECYSNRDKFENEHHKAYFVESRFNTHNQFLNFYLSNGIMGLLAFLFFFMMLFKFNYSNYSTFSFVLALFLFCCLENVLSRQLGAMLFGVVISFLFLSRDRTLASE